MNPGNINPKPWTDPAPASGTYSRGGPPDLGFFSLCKNRPKMTLFPGYFPEERRPAMKVYSVGVLTKGNPWYNNEPGVAPPPWARGSNIVKNGTI